MVDLREKYRQQIGEMVADAQANEEEAREAVKRSQTRVSNYETEVSELKQTARGAHQIFLDMARKLAKLAFAKEPSVEEVMQVMEPCEVFVEAENQRMVAQQRLEEAKDQLKTSYEQRLAAEDELRHIALFR